MPHVTVRDEAKRHNYQESAFCNSLVPYYLQVNVKDKNERAKFFRAANILLFDRFPIDTAGLTTAAVRDAKSKAKRFIMPPSCPKVSLLTSDGFLASNLLVEHGLLPYIRPSCLGFCSSKSLLGPIAGVLKNDLKRLAEWAQDSAAAIPRPSIHHHTDFKLGPSGFQTKRSTYSVDSPMAPPRPPASPPQEIPWEGDARPFPQLIDPSDPIFDGDVRLDVLSLERQRRRTAGVRYYGPLAFHGS
ncbi:hypothetical protein EYR36_009373 [Pleurotus pulmonarius]|nr:hypothetical protein EYR36_009373 [Pleurotus pulmonarius]KAF4592869.1 hypothetical protein EYR38_008575 [Pleurotus pulmonarius]